MSHYQTMDGKRIFEIANEAGVDAKTALAELHKLGSDLDDPIKRLDPDLTEKLRAALVPLSTRRAVVLPPAPSPRQARTAGGTGDLAPVRPKGPVRPMPKEILGAEHTEGVSQMIPGLYKLLLECGDLGEKDGIVVVYHDAGLRPEYGLCNSKRQPWTPRLGMPIARDELLSPLRTLDRRYRDRALMPPNTFIAIDVPNRRAWFSRTFHLRPTGPYLDAVTLKPTAGILNGDPARLAPRAQLFQPHHVPRLMRELGSPLDRADEAFLLHEELLELAVDSLDSDEQLDPLPVHLNALWVFARPVIMRRPDDTERHIRAIWYRQGELLWRIRTFTAGIGSEPKEVGARLASQLPFVPVWEPNRPEQKLLAAVWALMAQGDVTELARVSSDPAEFPADVERPELTIVRVKAGTTHAQVYRADRSTDPNQRAAWSVRGHWRHQPYPTLGQDESGNVITKMKWIAKYTKGRGEVPAANDKVIVVGS